MGCDSSTKDWYARRGIHQRTLTVSHGEVEVSFPSRASPEGVGAKSSRCTITRTGSVDAR